jgi:hypothetical protein
MSTAVAATGTIIYTDADATTGKVVIVGGVTYTLKTGALVAAGDVKIVAGKADATLRNLEHAINGTGGVVGTDYYATAANASASAILDPFENTLLLTARSAGAAGNLIALSSDEPTYTESGAGFLAGGIDGDSAVVPWSLLSLEEAKSALRARGAGLDDILVRLLSWTADIIERELGFRPVTDLGTLAPESDVDETHDLSNPQGFLHTLRRPIRSVTAVYAGQDSTALPTSAYSTDFAGGVILLNGGTVAPSRRLLGGFESSIAFFFPEDAWRFNSRFFPAGTGMARVVYKAGWANTASVDGALKSIAADVLARLYRAEERKSQGVSSEVAQGFTIATKFDLKALTDDLRSRLLPFKTFSKTARR